MATAVAVKPELAANAGALLSEARKLILYAAGRAILPKFTGD
jgi:hypothetical protein